MIYRSRLKIIYPIPINMKPTFEKWQENTSSLFNEIFKARYDSQPPEKLHQNKILYFLDSIINFDL